MQGHMGYYPPKIIIYAKSNNMVSYQCFVVFVYIVGLSFSAAQIFITASPKLIVFDRENVVVSWKNVPGPSQND